MKVTLDGAVLNLPDFLVVGAAKSATTSLHRYLDEHPEIAMPAVKESWFFSFAGNPPTDDGPGALTNVISDIVEYSKLFDDAAPGALLGDASPSYLYTYDETIANIARFYPPDARRRLKIIISLRDPVSRAYAQYYNFRRAMSEPLAFVEAMAPETIEERLAAGRNFFFDYVGFGRYHDQVAAYFEAFGRERVHVMLYEDFAGDAAAACREIFGFLGVDQAFHPETSVRHNELAGEPSLRWLVRLITSRNSVKRALVGLLPETFRDGLRNSLARLLLRRPPLDEADRRRLAVAYHDDIVRLEQLIGRDLKGWLK